MDINLLFWKNEGKTFLSRLRIWLSVLDPRSLFSSDAEIKNAHSVIGSAERSLNYEDGDAAWILSLVSEKLQPKNSATCPKSFIHLFMLVPVIYCQPFSGLKENSRPRAKKHSGVTNLYSDFMENGKGPQSIASFMSFFIAFFPISAPLVVASFLPHTRVKSALFWQFLLQSYVAGFNHANRNTLPDQGLKTSLKQGLLIVGSVAYATCAGAIPQIVMRRFSLSSPAAQMFFRSILPIPLSASLMYFNVVVIRSEESENGIQVFDTDGNSVGVSKAAGTKAVQETAVSRAALFGTTAAVPNLVLFLLQKGRFLQSPLLLAPIRHISTAIVLGLMLPVSFSLYPQLGTIKKENLEKEFQPTAASGPLFYHKGL